MNNSTQHLVLRRRSNLVIMTSISLLLMSFFVALASMTLPNSRKAMLGINSIIEGFGMAPSNRGVIMTDTDVLDIIRFRQALQAQGIIRGTGVYAGSLGTTLAIKGSLLFEKDSAVIKADSISKIDAVASLIKGLPNDIVITGYTDSRPVETPQFGSNWALSAARAMAVMDHFAGTGIDCKRMRVYGMGPEHPISANSSQAGRDINSRVEITIVGRMPLETGAAVHELRKGETPPPPVYHYRGYDIPLGEK